mmetsp:Transcript_9864/g.33005  ORF Transcript_9864/g.33005 Transcript_9864/m.33005 type:complete len:132 (+) Transcript_9864:186-581(+)
MQRSFNLGVRTFHQILFTCIGLTLLAHAWGKEQLNIEGTWLANICNETNFALPFVLGEFSACLLGPAVLEDSNLLLRMELELKTLWGSPVKVTTLMTRTITSNHDDVLNRIQCTRRTMMRRTTVLMSRLAD